MNPDMSNTNQLATDYGQMIRATIEGVCVKRIEEEEGRVPSVNEIAEHGHCIISSETGLVQHLWRGVPICEYLPAGYDKDGWRDAIVSEIRPAFVLPP